MVPAFRRMPCVPFVLDPIIELGFGSFRLFVSRAASIYSVPFLAVPLNEQSVSRATDSYKVSSTFRPGAGEQASRPLGFMAWRRRPPGQTAPLHALTGLDRVLELGELIGKHGLLYGPRTVLGVPPRAPA